MLHGSELKGVIKYLVLEMEKCACKLLSFVFNVMILNVSSVVIVFSQRNGPFIQLFCRTIRYLLF